MPLKADSRPGMKLKILTLNCWSEGKDYPKRWPVLAARLQDINPDVLGFQEIFQRKKAVLLQKALGYPVLIDGNKQHGGLAVVSNKKKIASGFIRYSAQSPKENYFRYALWIRLKISRQEWDIFDTHLSWRLPETEVRQRQVAELWDWIELKNAGKRPCIVLGDMNSTPQSTEMEFLSGNKWMYLSRNGKARVIKAHLPFIDTFAKIHLSANKMNRKSSKLFNTWSYRNPYTHRADLPERRIDFIWFRPEAGASKSKYKIHSSEICFNQADKKKIFPSDHFGVITEIETA